MFYLPGQTAPYTRARRHAALMKSARRFLAVIVAAALVSIGLLTNAQADNCALDPAFGSGGKVVTTFGPLVHSTANAAALQPDGKIVAAGSARGNQNDTDYDFALVRYNTDGTLDNSFGSGGKATNDFFGDNDQAKAVAIQPDHKIVVAGDANIGGSSSSTRFALARYNSDGTLDDGTASDSTPGDSFGNAGTVITEFFGSQDNVSDIALQTDGKIVVVGSTRVASTFTDVALARYNSDGTLDDGTANDSTPADSFGTGGKVTLDYSGNPDGASAVAIQPTDGKIIVAGAVSISVPFRTDFLLARYQTNGSLDPTFGNGGIVTTDFSGSDDSIVDMALQTDGKIVALGFTRLSGPAQFALARYNSDGSLDNAFGNQGRVMTVFPGAVFGNLATGVALQPGDGKIIAAGWIARDNIPDQNNESFALARYHTDGSLDTSFDGDGKTVTDFYRSEDEANDVLVQADGNIVLVGSTFAQGTYGFALARYLGDAADYPPTLDSLTLSTNILPGSGNLSGTVTLCGPAPAGGIKVTITDTLDAVTAPHIVTVPAGQTMVTFTIKTKTVTATQAGNVIAKLGPTSRSAQLVIKAIGLSSLVLEPNPVTGPNQVKGTVVLNGRAPEGGIIVSLSSKNPAVASPTVTFVIIPAGMQQKNFTIQTSDVPSPRSAIITATANGMTKSSVLRVN